MIEQSANKFGFGVLWRRSIKDEQAADRAWQRAFDNVLDGVDEEIVDGVRRAALGHLKAAEEFGYEDEIEPLYDLMALDPEWYGRVIE